MFEYLFMQAPVTYRNGTPERSSYEDVIRAQASRGWRLVQVLVETPAAMPGEYQLIFERQAAD